MVYFFIFTVNEIQVVSGLEASRLGHLHTLELRGNKLKSTKGICLPQLKNLFLVSFDQWLVKLPYPLCILSFFEPFLDSNVNCYLKLCITNSLQAGNIIKALEDLHTLTSLSTLHLRDNQLEILDGFSDSMLNLEYINMRFVA